jgi:hypothetical protein
MIDVGVIVEPRCHKYLFNVIDNVIRMLNIKVILFHGTDNITFINDILNNYIVDGKLILREIKLDNKPIKNLTISNYNKFMCSYYFWNNIDYENILIFQTDSCVLNIDNNFINIFTKYDYIGANVRKKYNSTYQNGGFSFRKKSAMLKVLDINKKRPLCIYPEDKFFTCGFNKVINIAPRDIADKFSVEQFYNYDKPFGCHKPWAYIFKNSLLKNKFIKNNPEFNNVFNYI